MIGAHLLRRSSMPGTSWIPSSVLAVVLGEVLATPAEAATPDAWNTTKIRLALQSEQKVQGFPATGRWEPRRWPRASMRSWRGNAMRAPRHICATV
jgi:hypothetical protein